MQRLAVAAAVALACVETATIAQQAVAPAFEVASIKRNTSGTGISRVGSAQPGRFVAVNVTPMTLILNAYGLLPFRVLDAPRWMETERYDVEAVGPRDIAAGERSPMIKTLLAVRFKLVARIEKRPMPVYALVRARADAQLGPELRHWEIDCDALRASKAPVPAPANAQAPPTCGMSAGPGRFAAGGYSIESFARSLASELSAPVIDQTQLTGEYSINLRWNPDPGAPGTDASLPSLFTAVQEQLGLRLESRREPMDVLVIESIERPTEN